MSRVLLKVSSNDHDGFTAGCDYAVVNVTPELARQILARGKQLKQLAKGDDALSKMVFHAGEGAPLFYSEEDLEGFLDNEFDEEQLETIAGRGVLVLLDTVSIPTVSPRNVRCPFLLVYEDGVRWQADPKNEDFEVQTARLDFAIIESMIK